jgi:hypothetical protein
MCFQLSPFHCAQLRRLDDLVNAKLHEMSSRLQYDNMIHEVWPKLFLIASPKSRLLSCYRKLPYRKLKGTSHQQSQESRHRLQKV